MRWSRSISKTARSSGGSFSRILPEGWAGPHRFFLSSIRNHPFLPEGGTQGNHFADSFPARVEAPVFDPEFFSENVYGAADRSNRHGIFYRFSRPKPGGEPSAGFWSQGGERRNNFLAGSPRLHRGKNPGKIPHYPFQRHLASFAHRALFSGKYPD